MLKRRDLSAVQPCRISRRVHRIFLLALLSIPLAVQGHAAESSSPPPAPVQGPPSPFEPLPYDTSSSKKDEPFTVVRIARDWQNDKLDWETRAGRSYLLPAGEILLYEFLLNLFDRNFVEPKSDYQTNGDTIWKISPTRSGSSIMINSRSISSFIPMVEASTTESPDRPG